MDEQRRKELEQQLYFKEVDHQDFEQANIPKRLYRGCKLPEKDVAMLNEYIELWSADAKRTTPEHGLLFYSPEKIVLAELYVTYILIKLMRKRRTVYLLSTRDLDKDTDEEFLQFLYTRDCLGFINFPFQVSSYEPMTPLYRVLTKRYNNLLPTLLSSEIPLKQTPEFFKNAPPSVLHAIMDSTKSITIEGSV